MFTRLDRGLRNNKYYQSKWLRKDKWNLDSFRQNSTICVGTARQKYLIFLGYLCVHKDHYRPGIDKNTNLIPGFRVPDPVPYSFAGSGSIKLLQIWIRIR